MPEKPTVCIVTPDYLTSSPRTVKEADALHAAGFRVRVAFTQGNLEEIRKCDETLLAGKPWEWSAVGWSPFRENERSLFYKSKLRFHLARQFSWMNPRWAAHGESRVYSELRELAASKPAGLFIGHYPAGLAAAAYAASKWKARLGYDIEDLHTEEPADGKEGRRKRDRIASIERRHIRQCSYLTAASELLADAVARRYRVFQPEPVHNVFPWSDRNRLDGRVKDRRGPALSIYWCSQVVGEKRGIEDLIRAAGLVDEKIQIHLRGFVSEETRLRLTHWARRNRVEDSVYFHPAVPPEELLSRAVEHDVGLAGEEPVNLSRALCVTNKFFFYLLAGLAVAASDVPGQKLVMAENPGTGFVFPAGDAAALAGFIREWIRDPEKLKRQKEASLAAARDRWNWEQESQKIVRLCRKALETRHVAIVAPHFVPSPLTAVHRSRLLAGALPDFGWRPTIITVHEKYYEEASDPALEDLLPQGLKIRKARAIPVKPVRWVGDIGIRGFFGMFRQIKKLHDQDKIDFLYITIPSNYAALLGPLAQDRLGIPYGIDYIDPWVHEWPGTQRRWSKAWFAFRLAKRLEPFAVKNARLISGISPAYYAEVLARNRHLKDQAVTASMPYGWSEGDYECLNRYPAAPFVFSPQDRKFHLVYAGALLPKAHSLLEILFSSIRVLTRSAPELVRDFRLHFIGTGNSADGAKEHSVQSIVEKFGLPHWVSEFPGRIGYLDVLNHLRHASAVLVLGSTESHYAPSKIFQAVLSNRPVMAFLHEESAALDVLKTSGRGIAVTFGEGRLPGAEEVAGALEKIIRGTGIPPAPAGREPLQKFSAKESARVLSEALNKAVGKNP